MNKVKDVYSIIEREGLDKNFWMKVGVAFVNRDESLSIRLDAMPVNGLLHVRDRRPKATATAKLVSRIEKEEE